MRFIDNFRLKGEREDYRVIIETIEKGVPFKGTNLWILVFAIFIACLGLNVNSTAVIIGAMLVSPLMGPIMGLGLSMGINDLPLLRKSMYNYLFAAGVGLATSTLYFLVSPLRDAHSEILSRTSPNIYDVLIALAGGFAGILATSSKQKGNVIPGVAIATALMPPLCTAGFGLATFQFYYFFGALYLFVINSVFIGVATLLTTRYLGLPLKDFPNPAEKKRTEQIIWVVVILTFLPSVYFGYDIVLQNRFIKKAESFITFEAKLPNNYLLSKSIDAEMKKISLTYGGELFEEGEVTALKMRMPIYGLDTAMLDVSQGFSYLREEEESGEDPLIKALNEKDIQLIQAIGEKESAMKELSAMVEDQQAEKELSWQIFNELKVQYPVIESLILSHTIENDTSTQMMVWVCVLTSKSKVSDRDRTRVEEWLTVRLNLDAKHLRMVFEQESK